MIARISQVSAKGDRCLGFRGGESVRDGATSRRFAPRSGQPTISSSSSLRRWLSTLGASSRAERSGSVDAAAGALPAFRRRAADAIRQLRQPPNDVDASASYARCVLAETVRRVKNCTRRK
ncbi:unnamed protein product [Lampetra fluviatilis]